MGIPVRVVEDRCVPVLFEEADLPEGVDSVQRGTTVYVQLVTPVLDLPEWADAVLSERTAYVRSHA